MRLPNTRHRLAAKPGTGERTPSKGRPRGVTRALAAALLLGALALGLGLIIGLRGPGGDGGVASAGRPSLPQTDRPLIVYSEFGPAADTIWAADPSEPTKRAQLGLVEHAWGYGILPSVSPDGAYVAYTVLPAGGAPGGSGTGAELWLLQVTSGETTRLIQAVDLVSTPIWSPESDAVVVRRSQGQEGAIGRAQLLRVDLAGAAAPIAAANGGLFPIDFSPDGGWLYYAVLSPSGTNLARAPAGGGGAAETMAHLSDGVARDWHLSPDGTRLAYLAQEPTDTGVAFAARVLDLSTGSVQTPLGGAAVAQFNPVWERSGGLTIGQLDSQAAGGGPLRLSADGGRAQAAASLPGPPAGGFDVPLSWSPDGGHLAMRSFEGTSVASPGPSYVVVVGTDGTRQQLSPLSDVAVAGWLGASE